LTLIGPAGLGKTMWAVWSATKEVQLGYTARFLTTQNLAGYLSPTTAVGLQRLLKPSLSCDVLVLDELCYLPTEPYFGPALYEIIADRYERRLTVITSNNSLAEWGHIVQNASLTAALIDRLMHHVQVSI